MLSLELIIVFVSSTLGTSFEHIFIKTHKFHFLKCTVKCRLQNGTFTSYIPHLIGLYSPVRPYQIANCMGPTWGPHGSCRLGMGPFLPQEPCHQGLCPLCRLLTGFIVTLDVPVNTNSADSITLWTRKQSMISSIFAQTVLFDQTWWSKIYFHERIHLKC